MITEQIEGQRLRAEVRTQKAKSVTKTTSKVGSGLIGSSGETNKEGIFVDQYVTEANDQLIDKKIDLDNEASIPDIRSNQKRSSTLEDRNSSPQTRGEYQ